MENEEEIQHAIELDEAELEYAVSDDGTEGKNLVKYRCSHCQAEMITDRATAASICVYCGKPIIMTEQVVGDFAPKYVIPFEKTQDEAMNKFKEFMHKPLTPKDFYDSVTVDKVQGIYIPYWLYTGRVKTAGTYECKNLVSEKVLTKDGKPTGSSNRKWDTYRVSRSSLSTFEFVPADGSSKTDDTAMQSIEPYDFSKMLNFDMAYLSGFLAERYDEDSESIKPKIEERIRNSAHDKVVEELDYDRVSTKSFDYKLKFDSVDYALLPAWLLYCTYKEKRYLFAMNGQTGKFIGNLPIDILKAVLIGIGTFVGTGVVSGILTILLNS